MNYKVSHQTKIVNCEINLPSSKSISNRLLIIRALCKKKFEIENLSTSDDTQNLAKALHSNKKKINVNHAGTSFRFLTSYLAIQENKEYILTGSKRIKERPIKELVSCLRKIGAEIDYIDNKNLPPLKIKGGKIKGGKIEINGNISSQFITSILLIAPTLKNGIELKIKGDLVSRSYIEMTLKLMKEFGIRSNWKNNTILIQPQNYMIKNYTVEADWSAASFWMEIAALSKDCNIHLNGLQKDSIQGDRNCTKIFNKLGVDINYKKNKVILTKNQKIANPKIYNLIETPDLYQPLACTLFAKKIQSKFLGIQTLKDKETDRKLAVDIELEKLNSTNIINTYEDHRMAMSFAPLCLRLGEIQINNIEVVTKSYTNFWNDLKKGSFTISPLAD